MSKIHIDLFFMVIYVIFHKSCDIGTCFFAVNLNYRKYYVQD